MRMSAPKKHKIEQHSNSSNQESPEERGTAKKLKATPDAPPKNDSRQHDDSSLLKKAYDQKIRPFIDLIDELRKYGLEQDMSLPSVVVVGDQSSGKSSILEAISGVQLPRGKGIVTRCPLEMQLKRTPEKEWSATLSYTERDSLKKLKIPCHHPDEVEREIKEAQNRLAGTSTGISNELITLRVESPSAPDLTLIDLPGITRTAVEGQTSDIITQIRTLITSYISKPNSVILCVISANLDIAVNEAISLAKSADPDGMRTLGVITKPDIVEDMLKQDVVDLLNNIRVKLSKGFSMVKCRSLEELGKHISLEDALANEKKFFAMDPVYKSANPRLIGTPNLANRLTEELYGLIRKEIPKLKVEALDQLTDACESMKFIPLGPPDDQAGKLGFLFQTMSEFTKEMQTCFTQGEIVIDSEGTTERNVFYDWRGLFQWFQDTLEELTEKSLKADDGSLAVVSIRNRVAFERGRELSRFMNYDLFESLVRAHIEQYKFPATTCLTEFSESLQHTVQRHVDEHFRNFPDLKAEVLEVCETVRKQKAEEAQKAINFYFDQEHLVYTQDKTYNRFFGVPQPTDATPGPAFARVGATESPAFGQSLFGPAIPGICVAPQSSGNFKEVRKKHSTTHWSNDLENAELMHTLIAEYLKVVNSRLADMIPCCLRVKLHNEYLKDLGKKVNELISQPDAVKMVVEPGDVSDRRKCLQEKIKRLKMAALKLSRYS